ncbi:polysaccharide biosynthesis protein [Tamlana fucoidanivorans]|uniref:NAD-dependent epimerase/dehydratase family protein n=1 Tax=Allotamlana fucoidanivorans TaxID=2583814 RepID=A0A5C4SRI0_9FLAO|nr:polysaccharide biosynthesis protein [Tamlana fucoidanivorans]TNJ46449.1 NAD-dependent epimerase/dehydratase family protein [Tamlana fucoidanivorans]
MKDSLNKRIDTLIASTKLFPWLRETKEQIEPFDFSNEIILITGAAGSLGSELTKQLTLCKFHKLILVDFSETASYILLQDLKLESNETIFFELLDISKRHAVKAVFKKHKPTMVIHAAAYKHVPLLETNPYAAIQNNIFGTEILAELALEFSVKTFIFISTDKAVKPKNIMGMTKSVCEKRLEHYNCLNKTLFISARFGNIIGSNGSVLPLFKRQMEQHNSITITNAKASRYFMTKTKACQLILHLASFKRKASNIYTFQMGDAIRILDVANRLIDISSNTFPNISLEIKTLRPGEKTEESIISDNEILQNTHHPDIFQILPKEEKSNRKTAWPEVLEINLETSTTKIKSILKRFT